jgi:N-acetylmuramoyl-L-alanine amidase
MFLTRIFLTLLIFPASCIFSAQTKNFPKNKFNSANLSSKPLVVIDPGHGGLDIGAKIRKPYIEEKRLALTTAIYLKRDLLRMGYRVVLTRYRDQYITLPIRAKIANRAKAALFISLHFNSCKNNTAKGIEIFYNKNEKNKKRSALSRGLASCILQDSVKQTKMDSRGVKSAGFVVIKETKMPSVLVEGGFLTNFSDRQKLRQREFLLKLAKGIAIGSDKFLKSKMKTKTIRLARAKKTAKKRVSRKIARAIKKKVVVGTT